MFESASLQELSDIFIQLQEKAQLILSDTKSSKLLSDELVSSTIALLQEAQNKQAKSIEEISSIIGVPVQADTTITNMYDILVNYQRSEQKALFVAKAREIFVNFLLLYSDDEKCNCELTKRQNTIETLTDDQVSELEFEYNVEPYNEFYNLVNENDRNVIAEQAKKLKTNFSDALIMGLFLKTIHIRNNSNEPSRVPVQSKSESSDKGTAKQNGISQIDKHRLPMQKNKSRTDNVHKSDSECIPFAPTALMSPQLMKKGMESLLKSSSSFSVLPRSIRFIRRPTSGISDGLITERIKFVPEKIVPEKVVLKKTAPEEAVSEKTSTKEVTSEKIVSKKAVIEKSTGKVPTHGMPLKENEVLEDIGITNSMSPRDTAQVLLSKNLTPEHCIAYDYLLNSLLCEGKSTFEDDRVENSLARTLILSKALSFYAPHYYEYHMQLTLAVDSPISEHHYDGKTLLTLFEGEKRGSAFHLAALFRSLFAPDISYDYSLHSYAQAMFEDFEHIFAKYIKLKPLYNLFIRINSVSKNGFSMPILRSFGNNQAEQEIVAQIKGVAKGLLSELVIKSRINALIPMKALCFGQNSDLHECMEIIAEDRRDERELVRITCDEYCDLDEDGIPVVSQEKINEAFSRNWRKATEGIRAPRELISVPKAKIMDGFYERIEVMRKWLEITEDLGQEDSVNKQLIALRSEIINEIEKILPAIDDYCSPGDRTVFKALLSRINDKLAGQIAENYSLYADLLGTGIFETDAAGLPIIERTFSAVQYYEPWRNALRHIVSPTIGFRQCLSHISDMACLYQFDNIGQAIAICRYLSAHSIGGYDDSQYIADIPRAKESAEKAIESFKGELELAFAYGRISETLKEDILEYVTLFEGNFFKSNDFGCLRAFLDALRHIVRDSTNIRFREIQDDISRRRNTNKQPKLEAVLNVATKKLMEPEQNFVVAEEYINRFDAGIVDELDMNKPDSESEFLHFISDQTFGELNSLCRKNQNLSLRGFGWDYVESELKKQKISAQYLDSSKTLIRSLPNIPEEVNPAIIERLLSELGYSALDASVVLTTSAMVRVSVKVKPDPKDKAEYAHPVDIMGTKLKSPIDVICLFGKMQANDIVNRVCGLELSHTAIVFLNGALDLPGRRQIAERFHREKSGQNSFLLVDWVLMLYLALHQKSERLPVFLSCSLPYTSSFQPFVTSGSVSDEMFIGRKRELNQILDPKGPVIVYGGRQLGKTALLERALSRANHPSKKEYAVLIRGTALCKNEQELAEMIVQGLRADGLDIRNVSTLKDLCVHLRKKYDSKVWTKLLLLIDEADTILADFRKTTPAYKPLIPLSDLKRETGNDFKFILAGLHNVCRAAIDPNTIFGQLGGALCIKPLTSADALELLSRPLRYMGFQVSPTHLEHILVNTSFYPGIVHYVGYSLVENLSTKYSDYYQASRGNPPYDLTDKQLGDIMSNDALNEKINERIRWTLSVDPQYFMLARCVAYLYYDYPEDNKGGYSTSQIMEYAELLDIRSLKGVSEPECSALLRELVEMGILVLPTKTTFRLRQRRFLDAIGNSPEKIESDIREAERGIHDAG